MRNYTFEIDGRTFLLSEGHDCRINGRVMTEWEVREDHGDHYHQMRNTHFRPKATKADMRNWLDCTFVNPVDEDDDMAA